MLIGTLALTGFPFLSGFYSKDLIIEFAYLKGNTVGYYACGIGIFTALLTSIYSWRLIFKTFHGDFNNKNLDISNIHESPFVMIAPLIILAIGSIFAGFIFKNLFIICFLLRVYLFRTEIPQFYIITPILNYFDTS